MLCLLNILSVITTAIVCDTVLYLWIYYIFISCAQTHTCTPQIQTMREEEVETAIKVVVVGNGAVGKSSMIQRYCKGIFTKDYKKTIGVDFLERQIE